MIRRIALESAALIVGGSFHTPAYPEGSGDPSVRLSLGKKTQSIGLHIGELTCFDGEETFDD